MSGESKPARLPWVIVGVAVVLVVSLALSPPSFREGLTHSIKAFILKVHDAARPKKP